MKKLIVYIGKDFINIPCDRIFQDEHFLYGYRGDDLVGMFMIGTFEQAYINEVKSEKGNAPENCNAIRITGKEGN